MLQDVLNIFLAMLRVGIFGFGGGPSVVPLIKNEVVGTYKWMTKDEFVDTLALGNSLPGPIATKLAAYTGYKIAGVPGAVSGLIGMVLPSAIMMIVLLTGITQFKDLPAVKGALKALKPAVLALLAYTAFSVWDTSVVSWDTFLIAVLVFVFLAGPDLLPAFPQVHPALLIVVAFLFGALVYGRAFNP